MAKRGRLASESFRSDPTLPGGFLSQMPYVLGFLSQRLWHRRSGKHTLQSLAIAGLYGWDWDQLVGALSSFQTPQWHDSLLPQRWRSHPAHGFGSGPGLSMGIVQWDCLDICRFPIEQSSLQSLHALESTNLRMVASIRILIPQISNSFLVNSLWHVILPIDGTVTASGPPIRQNPANSSGNL